MTNAALAEKFETLSKLLDLHGENPFRTKTYASAAFTLERLQKEVSDMSEDEFHQIRGFGDAITAKIKELQQTGELSLLNETLQKTPPGVLEMLHIKGLGPKKIAAIWKELGIEEIGELEYACTENRLAGLKGFGQKTQDKICGSVRFYQSSLGLHLFAAVEEPARQLLIALRKAVPGARFEQTGALRRQEDTISIIEIVTDAPVEDLQRIFEADPENKVTCTTPLLTIENANRPDIFCYCGTRDSFAARLFRTTAATGFLEAFEGHHPVPAGADAEEDIFTASGLPFIPAPLRNDARTLRQAIAGKPLPVLVRPDEIRGIIHSHTSYSDGAETLERMAKGAKDAGFEYIVISDHSQAAYYAGGLKPERIQEQHLEIDALNKKLAPFRIFKSIEADILGDGELDYDSDILASFDLVIASVHSNLQMTEEKAMDRVLAAVRNPHTRILGHPTGRLLLSRAGYPINYRRLIDECAAYDVVIEINAHPRRLDLDWQWIPYAMEKGVLLSVDPDAHALSGFKDVRYGVLSAQKGGLTADFNLSSKTLTKFTQWLEEGRKAY